MANAREMLNNIPRFQEGGEGTQEDSPDLAKALAVLESDPLKYKSMYQYLLTKGDIANLNDQNLAKEDIAALGLVHAARLSNTEPEAFIENLRPSMQNLQSKKEDVRPNVMLQGSSGGFNTRMPGMNFDMPYVPATLMGRAGVDADIGQDTVRAGLVAGGAYIPNMGVMLNPVRADVGYRTPFAGGALNVGVSTSLQNPSAKNTNVMAHYSRRFAEGGEVTDEFPEEAGVMPDQNPSEAAKRMLFYKKTAAPSLSEGEASTSQNIKNALVPVNMRKYISHLLGDRSPITESDFTEKDLDAIRYAIEKQGGGSSGTIGYGDYSPQGFSDFGNPGEGPLDLLKNSYTDPAYRMETTLGMASYRQLPDGSYVVEDRYNFNAPSRKYVNDILKKQNIISIMSEGYKTSGLSGILNVLGNAYGDTESEPGTPVSIRLPRKAKKYQEGGEVEMPEEQASPVTEAAKRMLFYKKTAAPSLPPGVIPDTGQLDGMYQEPTVASETARIFGMQPREDRGSILPIYKSNTGLVAPDWMYDIARNATAADMARRGYAVAPEEGVNMALNFTGAGLGTSTLMRKPMGEGGVDLAMNAYHGSPYNIAGKFDVSKAGTGTGAKQYGHGVYFAEARPTAERFKKGAKQKGFDFQAEEKALGIELPTNARSHFMILSQQMPDNPALKPADAAELILSKNPEARNIPKEKLANLFQTYQEKTQGNLYQVDIPDAQVAKMLDWNKPLSEQSPEVLDILKKIPAIQEDLRAGKTLEDLKGGNAYQALAASFNVRQNEAYKLASDFLNAQGIPGVRYDDYYAPGQSNFVVFDPSMVQMLMRNDKPVSTLPSSTTAKEDLANVPGVLPKAERDANLNKMLEKSVVKEPVYHSTYSDFPEFKTNFGEDEYFQFGAHVGSVDAASNRLSLKQAEDAARGAKGSDTGANIMPVYAKITNPLRLDENRTGRWGVDDIMSTIMEKADAGDIKGIPPNIVDDFFDDNLQIEKFLGKKVKGEPRVWQNTMDWQPGERSKLLTEFIEKLGHDGIVYNNLFEGGGDSYLVLRPTQLKSATGNKGTYDTESPVLNKAKGGEVRKPK
jgi:hypothetical protein